jgi:hypothetical protein
MRLARLTGARTRVKLGEFKSLETQKSPDAATHLCKKGCWDSSGLLGLPVTPIEAFQMVGKDHSLDGGRLPRDESRKGVSVRSARAWL